MRKVVIFGAFLATAIAAAAQASAPGPLSFRELEYQQPRDPLTGSNPAFVEVNHASADQLSGALAAVEAAVPAGTDRQTAENLLHRAGARCQAGADAETCIYRDVETVDEYMDDVTWTVRITTDGGKVASIALDRSWQRH